MSTTAEQRRQNRERQQRFRNRKKQDSHEIASANDLAERINADGLAHRVKHGKCFIGEVSPGVDAATLSDGLQVARELGRLLRVTDVRPDESLIQFERRVWDAWIAADCPFWIRKSQTLVKGWGRGYHLSFGGFEKSWVPLQDSDKPIQTKVAELRDEQV